MSDHNPFEKPVDNTPSPYNTPGARESIPTGVMVISIIALLLGLMGLFGSCFGAAVLLSSDFFVGLMPDQESKDAMREMMAEQFVIGIIQSVVSLIVSALLVAGAIGCLTRKPWGASLIRLGMFASILTALLGIGMTIWTVLFNAEQMAGANAGQMGKEQALQFFYVQQGIAIVMMLVFLGFYIFGAIYFGRQSVRDFFDRQADIARQGLTGR